MSPLPLPAEIDRLREENEALKKIIRGSEATKHSELPWHYCGENRKAPCVCKQIWCADYPVATVISGKWGDDYPAIRLVGASSLDQKVEAYMEQITYGEIPKDLSDANIVFIVEACNNYYRLRGINKELVEACEKIFLKVKSEQRKGVRLLPDEWEWIELLSQVLAKAEAK